MATTSYGRYAPAEIGGRSATRSPSVAAILSFFVPGLGQAYAGRLLRGFVFFLPTVVAVVVALAIGTRGWLRGVVDPGFLNALFWANIALFVYRVWAIVDAYLVARRRQVAVRRRPPSIRAMPEYPRARRVPRPMPNRASRTALGVVACLVVASVGIHGYVAAVDLKGQSALARVFNPLTPWSSPAAPGTTPAPTATPNRDWAADGKLNVLLIGIDRGPGEDRNIGLRPDSMILLQVDLNTHRAAMYGIPRNLVNVPLPPEVADHYACHCWGPDPNSNEHPDDYLLDYFWQEAAVTHPDWYAMYGSDPWVRGIKALEGAVGELTGAKIDGAFLIDLVGFIRLIDSIGGIWIDVPKELRDTQYPILEHPGTMTIDIKAGLQHMDGVTALEYARSRKSTDDYDRMRRQQMVLRAVRDQVAHPCSIIPKVPDILDKINGTFWTDMPLDAAPDLLGLAERVGTSSTKSYTLVPAGFDTGSTDVQVPEYLDDAAIAQVRNLVAHGTDATPSASPSPSSGGGGGGGGFGLNFGC